jgi:serine/threonine protein kinase
MYLQLQSADLALPFVILESAEFQHQSDNNATILVLPYAHTIDFQKHSMAERIAIFINILKCVDGLHDLGFIHGDLKRRHFLNAESTHDSPIQLIDFAQSQPINSVHSSHLKNLSKMTATPAYMAPELFNGQAKSVQSDLYALGIIFYEILVGEKPYTVFGQLNSYQQWATAHCQQEIPLLPKGLQKYQECLDHMLAKQKKNRASAIKSVISDLKINENYEIDD